MKRWILALIFLLLAVPVFAQEVTPEAPGITVVEAPTVTTVYVEVMPVWVLPAFALCLATMAFLIFVIWRQGGKLAEMLSEDAVQGLIKIGLDFARDLANKTTTPIDNAFLDVVAGEVKPPATVNVNVQPSAPAG